MKRLLYMSLVVVVGGALSACSRSHPYPQTITVITDPSPANLDPRVGTDASSERIDELIFDSLVRKDEHLDLRPWVAARWETPDPRTYVFHLHPGIRFHDGRPLTARDVKWTIDSMSNGTVISSKAATTSYQHIDSIEARDDQTVVFHMKEPDSGLLWNLSDAAMGIVPYGSDKSFNLHPIGSGPFKLVRNEQDNEVLLERNDDYWTEKPKVERVRFAIVPDATTRALELRKGSADIEINSITADTVRSLRAEPTLVIEQAPGTSVQYLGFNLRDPVLSDIRVRQALAYAVDINPIIHYLWRDTVRPADSVLPQQHWAYDAELRPYPHDPQRARELLAEAGYSTAPGHRIHLVMKTSTEEASRLIAVILQQQFREVGVDLEIRTFEFATFYSDVVRGAYQMYTLRWVGGSNQDPEIFEYIFDSKSFAPRRANRSYYSNPQVDVWIEQARSELDQNRRKELYARIQQQVLRDLPSLNLFSLDNVIVHTRRVRNVSNDLTGNFDFLRQAEITQ
ncbi:MAG: ABC transporter substrate-binding protein [Acidobacteria bacterium]|nr:ABC transporter substrate-binding protein [Acidobacteriota bacterium]MBV9147440.1 ABC transporter substrate-binding protein [Acidobacteriota bacterium]MBV9438033.1 ABC transporter substrate-binding protein [Acidobacteriota bacterium]